MQKFNVSRSNNFTRTQFHNKMADVMYHQNGSGRDTYIYNNNGGFSVMHSNSNVCPKPGRFLPKVRDSPIKHPSLSQSKPRKYY